MSDYRVDGAREYFNSPNPQPEAQRRGRELLAAADDRLRWLTQARAELEAEKRQAELRSNEWRDFLRGVTEEQQRLIGERDDARSQVSDLQAKLASAFLRSSSATS